MTITPWMVYWIGIMDSVSVGLFLVGFALLFVGGIGYLMHYNSYCRKDEDCRMPKRFLIVFCFGIFIWIVDMFTPCTKNIAAIYLIPKIANNEKVQEIPTRLLTLADEWMDELKPSKKESK